MANRPTDNGREIPWIDEWARPVVELNPAAGVPTAADSHLAGPMCWPADEPWPWCEGAAHVDEYGTQKAAGVRLAMVSGAQLYRRDFPELPFPDGTDVLQVFLCTVEHEEIWGPDVHLVWRSSAAVTEVVSDPPAPQLAEPGYTAAASRVLRPTRTVEYATLVELPVDVVNSFEAVQEDYDAFHDSWPPVANGSKIGGWTSWHEAGPIDYTCPDCGQERRQLLALATHEPNGEHVGWEFGLDGILNVFGCTQDVRHSIKVYVD